jgi:hypothetical protein
LLRV